MLRQHNRQKRYRYRTHTDFNSGCYLDAVSIGYPPVKQSIVHKDLAYDTTGRASQGLPSVAAQALLPNGNQRRERQKTLSWWNGKDTSWCPRQLYVSADEVVKSLGLILDSLLSHPVAQTTSFILVKSWLTLHLTQAGWAAGKGYERHEEPEPNDIIATVHLDPGHFGAKYVGLAHTNPSTSSSQSNTKVYT